jgi:hypothetical protein
MPSRRTFLAAGALAAAIPAAAALPAGAAPASPAPEPTIAPLAFDLAHFDAIANRAARHRNMFATTKLERGSALEAVKNTLDAYALLKEPLDAIATAVVLYHGASIVMAFDDAVWKELLVPAIPKAPSFVKPDLTAYERATANPFLVAKNNGDTSVPALVRSGTSFFVCNNAAKGFAGFVAHALGGRPVDVYAQMVSGLVPGALLVPAGVWAVHALQERKYTYLQATL